MTGTGHGTSGLGSTGHSGGMTGSSGYSDPTGPHDSRLGNQIDPRVDSSHVGGYGNTGSTGHSGLGSTGHSGGLTGGHQSSGLTGSGHSAGLTGTGHNTYGSDPTGPHDSRFGNQVDPVSTHPTSVAMATPATPELELILALAEVPAQLRTPLALISRT
jgi:hypothetical protein